MIPQPWYSRYGFSHAAITLALMVVGYWIGPLLAAAWGAATVTWWICRELNGPEDLPIWEKLTVDADRFWDWAAPAAVFNLFWIGLAIFS